MHAAHLRLAAFNDAVRPVAPEPLLPADVTFFAVVDPRAAEGAREVEITDEMVRQAIESLDCEAVTPYRDGARPVASVAEAAAPRRSAEIIAFPVRRA